MTIIVILKCIHRTIDGVLYAIFSSEGEIVACGDILKLGGSGGILSQEIFKPSKDYSERKTFLQLYRLSHSLKSGCTFGLNSRDE